jgi:hypothetical protein|tara:strand:- start:361 stop:555 length:195 start_codon:yes stop_codon:yes gene_type:complete
MNKIIYKDKRYKVKRLVKEDPEEDIDYWKSLIPHDIVLKKNGKLWFLTEMTDAIIIEEINNGSE